MMAKRSLLWLLQPMAAILLWGCSSDEVVEEASSDVLITYQASTDNVATRGETITSTESFATNGRTFKIWGWMTDDLGTGTHPMTSDFNSHPLTAVDVTYTTANGWTTSEKFYWPRPRYRADFYAIYPASTVTSFTTDSKTITYTSTNGFDGNTDLMYATYSGQRPDKMVGQKRKEVSLTFHHAMTQILFYGKLSSALDALGWTVEVRDITIYNAKSGGTFTFEPYDANKVTKPEAMTFALGSTTTPYSPTMNITTPATAIKIDNTSMGDNSEVLLTSPLMLLPQTLTEWDSENENTGTISPVTSGGYLAISLRAIDNSGATPAYPLQADGGFVTVFAPFGSPTTTVTPDPADPNDPTTAPVTTYNPWLAGTLYKYILTFGVGKSAGGNDVYQPISIEAAIAPWIEATPVSGDIYRR